MVTENGSVRNLLRLDDPDKWSCKVVGLLSHETIKIFVRLGPATFPYSVYFSGVQHYSGPLLWTGADLRVDSDEDAFRLMQSIPNMSALSFEYVTLKFKLYYFKMIEPSDISLRILATSFPFIEFGNKRARAFDVSDLSNIKIRDINQDEAR